jgi:hypothetical protein
MCQGSAAPSNSNECELVQIFGLFKYFVRKANQSPIDFGGAHELLFFADHDWHKVNGGSDTPD